MALEQFRVTRFNTSSRLLIDNCNSIINRYLSEGYKLTLRQLYYQLVSANILSNQERSYKRLSHLVSEARLSGEIDWDAIEDRMRFPRMMREFEGLEAAVGHLDDIYRLPRWEGQTKYIELWVEKDALAGVLSPIANRLHVAMMVNRGYSSQTAMYESAKRFQHELEQPTHNGRERTGEVIYLGDHDPSGEDMVRDIRERFHMFGVPVTVSKLALTMAQVRKYRPPPQPAKERDSRFDKYVAQHGHDVWEVDALRPDILHKMVTKVLESKIDQKVMDPILKQEENDKAKLAKALKSAMRKA